MSGREAFAFLSSSRLYSRVNCGPFWPRQKKGNFWKIAIPSLNSLSHFVNHSVLLPCVLLWFQIVFSFAFLLLNSVSAFHFVQRSLQKHKRKLVSHLSKSRAQLLNHAVIHLWMVSCWGSCGLCFSLSD